MVTILTQQEVTDIVLEAMRERAPPGATTVTAKIYPKEINGVIEIRCRIDWMSEEHRGTPMGDPCVCTRITPCCVDCPCGFPGARPQQGPSLCKLCGRTPFKGELKKTLDEITDTTQPRLRLVPKPEDG